MRVFKSWLARKANFLNKFVLVLCGFALGTQWLWLAIVTLALAIVFDVLVTWATLKPSRPQETKALE